MIGSMVLSGVATDASLVIPGPAVISQAIEAAQTQVSAEQGQVTCRLQLPAGSLIPVESCTTEHERFRAREGGRKILALAFGRGFQAPLPSNPRL